jgi:hypothetical protein
MGSVHVVKGEIGQRQQEVLDSEVLSFDGLIAGALHKRAKDMMAGMHKDLVLVHVLGDGMCGWYSLWLFLHATGTLFCTELGKEATSWRDIQEWVLDHMQKCLDFPFPGLAQTTLRELMGDKEMQAVEKGEFKNFWLNWECAVFFSILWRVDVVTTMRLSKNVGGQQCYPLGCDWSWSSFRPARGTVYLVFTDKPPHYDVFLPASYVATLKKAPNALFRGVCPTNCSK